MSIVSKPFRPNPAICCEACVFGSGKHTCRTRRVLVIAPAAACPIKLGAFGVRLVDPPGTAPRPEEFLFLRS